MISSDSSPVYPVILSGGSGTRLWPLSRAERPKQFIAVVTDQSMMQDTMLRTAESAGFRGPLVVSSASHGEIVREQVEALGMTPSAILLEPEGRNTAAAIGIAAEWIARADPDALMLVMPSDHVIADIPGFHVAIAAAVPAALDGYLVTFGIQPTHAETGYGYIEKGAPLAGMDGVHGVARFVEKPPLEKAEAYLAGGLHYWNGGIFLFAARAYLDALATLAPGVAAASAAAMDGATTDGAMVHPHAVAFRASPNVSIDVAVMEQSDRVAVVPVSMGWSDVGSWDALWGIRPQDAAGNARKGPVIDLDGSGNLIYVEGGPPVAAIGMTDSIIVSTAAGVLVMPRSRSQDVKAVVDRIKAGAFDPS